jgi:3-deoxy-D-manno-octulosonate 8-phosphate phosphatase (KDO 8-P phosphatase)
MQDLIEKASQIRLVIFDVDGVLTDGSLFLGDDGQEYKAFHSRDGHGMKMLQLTGVEIAVITGRRSEVVKHRMANLGVRHLYQGQLDKRPAFEAITAELGIAPDEVAYVGDDVVDLPVMLRVGLAIAVQDAHPEVKRHAHWITPNNGGRGAAREVCEFIMHAQGTLEAELQKYRQ